MSPDAVIIATDWPPLRTPRAVMNARVFNALPWRGDLYVVDYLLPRAPEAPSPYALHRIPSLLAPLLGRLSLGECPDRHVGWAAAAAARALLRCERRRPDLLVSSGKWDSAHLAAWPVKRRHPRLPWIACFSDPWLDLERLGYAKYTRFTREVNRRQEAAVLAGADAIVYTCEETRALVAARMPEAAAKMYVISQSYDAAQYPVREPRGGPRRLVRYLGDFYAHRSPRPLLEAVRTLEREEPEIAARLEIEIVGRMTCHDVEECRALAAASRSVKILPAVSHARSLELMVESDALLVVDAPLAEPSPFLPSKLVEYLGADRPIVGLTGPGAAARVIRQAGCLVADVRDPEAVLAAVRALAEGPLARPLPGVRETYSHTSVSAQFRALAEGVAA